MNETVADTDSSGTKDAVGQPALTDHDGDGHDQANAVGLLASKKQGSPLPVWQD